MINNRVTRPSRLPRGVIPKAMQSYNKRIGQALKNAVFLIEKRQSSVKFSKVHLSSPEFTKN